MLRYVVLVTKYIGHRTYGIGLVQCEDGYPVLIETYADLSNRRIAVANLVRSCNRKHLDPLHLRDVVQDFIESH